MKRWSVLFLALALWALARVRRARRGRGGGGRSAFRFCGGLCTGCGGRSVRRQAGGSGPSPDGRGDPGGLFPGGGGVRLVQPGDAALRREDADHRRLALLSGGVPGHGKSGDLRPICGACFQRSWWMRCWPPAEPIPCIRMWTGPCMFCLPAGAGRVQGSGGHPDQAVRPGGILCHSRGGSAGRRRLYRDRGGVLCIPL